MAEVSSVVAPYSMEAAAFDGPFCTPKKNEKNRPFFAAVSVWAKVEKSRSIDDATGETASLFIESRRFPDKHETLEKKVAA